MDEMFILPVQNTFQPLRNDKDFPSIEYQAAKRVRQEVIADLNNRSSAITQMGPSSNVKPLIMTANDNSKLASLSPREKVAALRDHKFDKIEYSSMRRGDLMFYPKSEKEYKSLIAIVSFGKHTVTVRPPRSAIGSKGILAGLHFEYTEEEVLKGLNDEVQGSVLTVRFLKKKDIPGKATFTGKPWTALITFVSNKIPRYVVLDNERYPIREYKDQPIQCAKCCRFGHMARECGGSVRCQKCGKEHESATCSEADTVKCPNCGEPHNAKSKMCRAFVEAVKVRNLATSTGMSYRDAVMTVRERRQPVPTSAPVSGDHSGIRNLVTRPACTREMPQPSGGPSTKLGTPENVLIVDGTFWEKLRRMIADLVSKLFGELFLGEAVQDRIRKSLQEVLDEGDIKGGNNQFDGGMDE